MTRTAMEKKSKIFKKNKCLGNVLTYILYLLWVDLEQLLPKFEISQKMSKIHQKNVKKVQIM